MAAWLFRSEDEYRKSETNLPFTDCHSIFLSLPRSPLPLSKHDGDRTIHKGIESLIHAWDCSFFE